MSQTPAPLPPSGLRVVIAEDHVMFRDFLSVVCQRELSWTIVTAAGTGKEAKKGIQANKPDFALLDIHLPDGDGFEVAEFARKHSPKTKLVFVSSHCDDFTLFRVEQAKADGFVDKNTQTKDALVAACSAICRGENYYSPVFIEAQRIRARNHAGFSKVLSMHECTILSLIGGFSSNQEIADCLRISPDTAQKHRVNIMRKLGLHNATQMIEFAIKHGFSRVVTNHGAKRILP